MVECGHGMCAAPSAKSVVPDSSRLIMKAAVMEANSICHISAVFQNEALCGT